MGATALLILPAGGNRCRTTERLTVWTGFAWCRPERGRNLVVYSPGCGYVCCVLIGSNVRRFFRRGGIVKSASSFVMGNRANPPGSRTVLPFSGHYAKHIEGRERCYSCALLFSLGA